MFERYTDEARRVIFFSRYQASTLGAREIAAGHLLLGLMSVTDDFVTPLFRNAGMDLEAVRSSIRSSSPPLESIATHVELPLSSDAKRALLNALEESELLMNKHIGNEHLLLGLLREDATVPSEILRNHGFGLDRIREKVASKTNMRVRTDERPATKPTGKQRVVLGVERLLHEKIDLLRGARVGLICNQASVDHSLRHVADLFHEHSDINLTALFGPQHGIRGDVQDNMIETDHTVDAVTRLPIYSLYSETREPTEEMLKDVDVLVFDMQDVGCRIYTFVYTLANCMRAAKKFGMQVIACDRPNPINGQQVAGNVLDPEYASFVGQFPIPTRHGMTVGELARMFNERFDIGCDLERIPMEGWSRDLWLDQTDAPWVLPSPNMPTLAAATVFPGTVHVEGTQLSEGRGTTLPFELVGAPYVDPERLAKELAQLNLPGVYFRSCVFRPTFQKHMDKSCGGVQLHVTDRASFEPVISGIAVVKTIHDLYPGEFKWKLPPYEYEYDKNPFDVISGTAAMREAFERGDSLQSIEESWQAPLAEFMKLRAGYLMY
ncbi:MAG: hypothetical protein QOD75_2472 [Blastocatellia bacterium]|jgi:uncharacterized protein YbbC (DUF1343 family)|nr:hypothetical protein [Blastocatellia bacterium]